MAILLGFFPLIAIAQVASESSVKSPYEELLKRESIHQYPTRSTVKAESQEIEALLQQGFFDFNKRELQLTLLKAQVESHGHSALSFYAEMQEAVESLTESQVQLILESSDEASLQQNLSQSDAFLNELKMNLDGAKPLVAELFRELDSYIVDSLDFAMALGLYSARTTLTQVDYSKDLKKLYDELVRHKDKFLENKKHYGQGPDALRTTSFQKFMATLKKLYNAAEVSKPAPTRSKQRITKILRLFHPAMVINGFQFMKALLGAPKPVDGENPLTGPAMRISRRLGPMIADDVVVEGREHLPGQPLADEIYLFTPTHRDALADQVGVANLGVDNLIPFAAANNFIPEWLNFPLRRKTKEVDPETGNPIFKVYNLLPIKNWLINRLNQNLGLIVVGKKSTLTPIEKVKKILSETDLRNILIYPGGRLPEGLGHTMGVREKFLDLNEGLIGELEQAGYRVHIVPISMRDNARLLGGRRLTDSKILRIKVAPVLKDRSRKILTRLAGAEALGMLMRYGAIEDLVTNGHLLWGGVRASRTDAALGEYLFGEPSECSKLLSQSPTWQDPIH